MVVDSYVIHKVSNNTVIHGIKKGKKYPKLIKDW